SAASRGRWRSVSRQFAEFQKRYQDRGELPDPGTMGTEWQAMIETYHALKAFATGEDRYAAVFGRDIIDSIPAGSIYFGGTDPGRLIVTAMQRSHVKGDPFFTIAQDALAERPYIEYLRTMYDGQVKIPSREEWRRRFQDYYKDVERRFEHDKRFPDEPKQV